MDPNSTHQLWSKWDFVFTSKRNPTLTEVRENAARFFRRLFHTSAGQIRVTRNYTDLVKTVAWTIELRIEGPPAHDPECRTAVQRKFEEHFMKRGFGLGSHLVSMDVAVLAGDKQDGKPRDQLIVMPRVNFLEPA